MPISSHTTKIYRKGGEPYSKPVEVQIWMCLSGGTPFWMGLDLTPQQTEIQFGGPLRTKRHTHLTNVSSISGCRQVRIFPRGARLRLLSQASAGQIRIRQTLPAATASNLFFPTAKAAVDGCEIHFAPRKETMGTIALVGICRGVIRNQGFLGGAEIRPSTVWLVSESEQLSGRVPHRFRVFWGYQRAETCRGVEEIKQNQTISLFPVWLLFVEHPKINSNQGVSLEKSTTPLSQPWNTEPSCSVAPILAPELPGNQFAIGVPGAKCHVKPRCANERGFQGGNPRLESPSDP